MNDDAGFLDAGFLYGGVIHLPSPVDFAVLLRFAQNADVDFL